MGMETVMRSDTGQLGHLHHLLMKTVSERFILASTHQYSVHPTVSASIGSLSVATTATGPHTNSSAEFIKSTLVHKLFEGTLTSETRCLTCETVSSRDESFLDLSIDIEQNSSVTACLRQFSASEMLCQRNKFFCDGCCDLQEAEKRSVLF